MALPTPGTGDTFMQTLRQRSLGMTQQNVTAAGTALTTDVGVGGPKYAIIFNSSGTITSWSLANPVNEQEIELVIFKTVNANTVTWPTNIKWANNTPPTLGGDATWQIIRLMYFSSGTKWLEMSRSLAIPN